MGLGKSVVERIRLVFGDIQRRESGPGIEKTLHGGRAVIFGKSRPTQRIVGLKRVCFPEVFGGFVELTRVPEIAAVKVGIMCLGEDVACRSGCDYVRIETLGDGLRGFVGESGGVVVVSVAAVGPDVGVAGGVD